MELRKTAVLLVCIFFCVLPLAADNFDKYSEQTKIYMFIEAVSNMEIDKTAAMIPKMKDIDAANSSGDVAIVEAAAPKFSGDKFGEEQRVAMVKLLLANGADVNRQDGRGATALIRASEHGYMGVIRLLIEHKADMNLADTYGFTAMYWACEKKNLPLIDLLARNNADLNAQNSIGNTPLLSALASCETDMAIFLIKRGADIRVTNKNNSSPLFMAINCGDEKVTRLLLEKGISPAELPDALYVAQQRGHFTLFSILADKGASVNCVTRDGEPLLIHLLRIAALFSENKEDTLRYIRVLLKHRVDVNRSGNDGDTALILALQTGDKSAIDRILAGAKDVLAKGLHGRTACMIAAGQGFLDYLRVFKEKGANLNDRDAFGWTTLMYAASPEIAAYLVSASAVLGEVNAPDENGRYPLCFAIEKNNLDLVRLLLDAGANVNQKIESPGWNGASPLIMAAGLSRLDIARLLLERGADVNHADNDGMTAINYVVDNPAMSGLLKSHGGKAGKSRQTGGM